MFKNYIDEISKKEKQQLGIDFDGVIHKNSKGLKAGIIYDEPIEVAIDSIEHLNKNLGIDLIWEWLEKYNLKDYIKDVTYIKPNVFAYIDDKGVRFDSLKNCIKQIELINKQK